MTNTLRFGSTALVGSNKTGKLRSVNGDYDMIIGGLNIFNSAGEFYTYQGCEDLFKDSSSFKRRIQRGALRGEVGHPRREPGMTMSQFLDRIIDINEANTCVIFKEIWLDFETIKHTNGCGAIAIRSRLSPSGPKGDFLARQLEDPEQNVCFSIRSITENTYVGSQVYKRLKTIITFDNVNEPGIKEAEKWKSPSLESLTETPSVTDDDLRKMYARKMNPEYSTESSRLIASEILQSAGISLRPNYYAAFTSW